MLLVRCHCGGWYLHILGLVCCFTLSLSEGLQDLAKHRVQVNLASLYIQRCRKWSEKEGEYAVDFCIVVLKGSILEALVVWFIYSLVWH